jgi:hypothetical protein
MYVISPPEVYPNPEDLMNELKISVNCMPVWIQKTTNINHAMGE